MTDVPNNGSKTQVAVHEEVLNVVRRELDDHEHRLRDLERCIVAMQTRVAMWASIGVIAASMAAQAFTKFVLGW